MLGFELRQSPLPDLEGRSGEIGQPSGGRHPVDGVEAGAVTSRIVVAKYGCGRDKEVAVEPG